MNNLEEYYHLKQEMKTLKNKTDILRKEILGEMNEKSLKSLPVGEFEAKILEKTRLNLNRDQVQYILTDEQWNEVTSETGYQELKVERI